MTIPPRLQRSRRKGAKLPPDAVVVTWPTKWKNPYRLEHYARAEAVALFRTYLLGDAELLAAARRELRGKALACWCRPEQLCHADVLLEVVNAVEQEP